MQYQAGAKFRARLCIAIAKLDHEVNVVLLTMVERHLKRFSEPAAGTNPADLFRSRGFRMAREK